MNLTLRFLFHLMIICLLTSVIWPAIIWWMSVLNQEFMFDYMQTVFSSDTQTQEVI